MKVTSLDGRQLRKMLRKEAAARCVVLDCRPYLAFAASSVRGSLNVNLNSVVLRRARGGAVSARYVLPDEAARARLLQEGGGGVAAVVVLDQGSRHWQKLREESAARVVLTSLLACLPAGPRVYFLKGERIGAADSLSPTTNLPPRRRVRGSGGPLLVRGAVFDPGPGSLYLPEPARWGLTCAGEGTATVRAQSFPLPTRVPRKLPAAGPPGWVRLVTLPGAPFLGGRGRRPGLARVPVSPRRLSRPRWGLGSESF